MPSVIASGMVLQRDAAVPIWGWAEAGEEVSLLLRSPDQKEEFLRTVADAKGNWRVSLSPRPAGGPYTLSIEGSNTIELEDVLFGEVWLCSGQSNMEWPVAMSKDSELEIGTANYPEIRLFHVPKLPAGSPMPDLEASWQSTSPETIATFSAVAYYFGRELHRNLGVPVGLINSSWGGTRIEPWTPPVGFASVSGLEVLGETALATDASYREGLSETLQAIEAWVAETRSALASGGAIGPIPETAHPLAKEDQPTALYNGMIHPLAPFTIRGVIWYQGERNVGEGMAYHDKMRALINGWREVWTQGEFPFYYVQLAPFDHGLGSLPALAGLNVSPHYLPEIWEAQTASLAIANTGMVVTNDIGNLRDIHPRNKQEVGRRLSLWALAKTYGQAELVYSGPLYRSMEIVGDAIVLHFDHADGLRSRDGEPLSWFEIAGEDQEFVAAAAVIDGTTVMVSSDSVTQPTAVRFAWHQTAVHNLVNGAGLPASPFRTEAE